MTEQVQQLDVGNIKPSSTNRAIGDVKELAASIKAQGVLVPIVVRPNGEGFELVYGERRWTAAKIAGLETVPAIVREIDDEAALEIQLVENLQRKDIEPLEEAAGYARLRDHHAMPQSDIAKRVGRSDAHVSKRLALVELPDIARQALSAGNLSLDDAYELRELKDMPKLTAEALKLGELWRNMPRAIEHVKQAREAERTRQAKEKELRDEGVVIVDKTVSDWRSKIADLGANTRLGITVAKHKSEPCHGAFIGESWEAFKVHYVCTDPKRHNARGESKLKKPATPASTSPRSKATPATAAQKAALEKRKVEEQALEELEAKRAAFITSLVTAKRLPKDSWEHVARFLVFGTDNYEAGESAMVALGLKTGKRAHPGLPSRDKGVQSYIAASSTNLQRFALAVALFGAEDELKWNKSWNVEEVAHFAFLEANGYEISPLERKQLPKVKTS